MGISDLSSGVCSSDLFCGCLRWLGEDTPRAHPAEFSGASPERTEPTPLLNHETSDHLLSLVEALRTHRSEEHTSELQSLMRISYAVFCLKKKKNTSPNLYHILT